MRQTLRSVLGFLLAFTLGWPGGTLSVTQAQTVTPIPVIQGEGQFSPLVGQTVTTRGIVTLIHKNGRRFWIQSATGDGNPLTSEGLFVSDTGRAASVVTPQVGDLVLVTGRVEEQQFGTSLPLTRLRNVTSVVVESSGNPLPASVPLNDLPDENLADGIAFWEPLEGMLVGVRNARVVAPTNQFGEFAVLTRRDARPGSGYQPSSKHLVLRATGDGYDGLVDYNPERIAVDDESLATPIIVRPGDSIASLTGVVDYAFSMYKLQPASFSGLEAQPVPTAPVSRRSGHRGNLTVTTFNVENLFDLVDNPNKADEGSTPTPDQLETKLAKLALAVQLELQLPEILVVQEVENTAILQELGNRINAAAGTDYVATSFETSDVRGIEVGFLWDDNRVDLVRAYQLTDTIVSGVSAAFGPASASPGREPLVGVFNVTNNLQGKLLTIIGNHFKSKSGDEALYSISTLNGQNPNRITEVQRKQQAQVVRAFADQLLAADPDAWVMVAGDLNDFEFSEPGEGPDNPIAILEGLAGPAPLYAMVFSEREAERFSFVFDGNSQVLDHILISHDLRNQFVGLDFLHFNAGYPHVLNSDATTPLRVSDHDAVEARFRVARTATDHTLTVLQSNDHESKIVNAPGQPDFGGVARFKALADRLRAEALQGTGRRGAVFVSAGDSIIPGPNLDASLAKGVPYYDSIAMDLMNFDALAIGNHEFDLGPDVFADFIAGFTGGVKFVSANLDFSGEPRLQAFVDEGRLVKSHVIELPNGECLAVIGVTTPLLPAISSPRNVVADPNYVAAIQAEINRLEANGYNQILVFGQLQGINEDFALAAQLHGVDIIVSGGGQELLANPGNLLVPGDRNIFGPYPMYARGADGATIPVVTTNGDYKYIGRLIVDFDKDGRLISISRHSGPVRVAGGNNPDAVAPDPVVQAQVVEPVQAYLASLATTVVGTTEVPLNGLRNPGVRTQETNLGNLMADALLWQANQNAAAFGAPLANVAIQNGGGIRNNNVIPPGNLTELTLSSIAPFLNFVTIVPNIPPAQFKEIMENAVSNVEGVDGRFAQVAGFTLRWSASGTRQVVDNAGNVLTPGTRVVEIRLNDGTYIVQDGQVVAGAPSVNIATIDFLARGGDQYPYRNAPFITVGATYLQALRNYIIGPLGRVVTAAQYPEAGQGRITRLP